MNLIIPALLDSTKWGYDTGGSGWGNNELQYYTNSTDNASVAKGILPSPPVRRRKKDVIIPLRAWSPRTKEISCTAVSRSGQSCLLPGALWPAIWMLPTDWAMAAGLNPEIDIMEHVGFDLNNIHITTHTKKYYFKINTQKTATKRISNATTEFHLYRVDWTPATIRGYIDDELIFEFRNRRSRI